jgi:hypothetical protein
MGRRNSDSISFSYDAKRPRLASAKQIKKEQSLRDELNGDAHKKKISKVSLPKFSWEKTDAPST